MRQALPRLLALALFVVIAAPLATHAQDAPVGGGAKMKNDFSSNIDTARYRQIQRERAAKKKAQEKAAADAKKQAAADPAKAKADALAMAAPMAASAGIPCTVTDALSLGAAEVSVNGAKTTQKAVEVACQEGLGYQISQTGADKAEAQDCIVAEGNTESSFACILPANANPSRALQPYLVKASSGCVVDKARVTGETDQAVQYEVKCGNGVGQILQILKPRTPDSKALAASCLVLAVPGKPFPCTLTTEDANMAPVKVLATRISPACVPAKQRYVVGTSDGSDYFEFACEGGRGVIVQASATGDLVRTLDCARASAVAGGCTLTDASVSVAALQAEYAGKIAASGVKCDVAKIGALPTKPDGTEALEYSCKSGPGGIYMTKAGKSTVFNCGRSQAEGYACAMTPKDQAFADLTAQLKANGKMTCTVNGVAPRASASTAWLEVSCSDGNPGWMMKYARDSNTPDEVLTCKQFTDRGAGNCSLPSNKRDAA